MEILKTFGQNVRNIRVQKGISQEKLAELCGLHRTYISSIELGKRNVGLVNVQVIAKALNVSICELLRSE